MCRGVTPQAHTMHFLSNFLASVIFILQELRFGAMAQKTQVRYLTQKY